MIRRLAHVNEIKTGNVITGIQNISNTETSPQPACVSSIDGGNYRLRTESGGERHVRLKDIAQIDIGDSLTVLHVVASQGLSAVSFSILYLRTNERSLLSKAG
mgnify:FL=1